MNWSFSFSTIIILLLFSGCATTHRISSDFEKGVNFANYRTYQVLNHKDGFPAGANPINKQRIKRAITREMNSLGFIGDQHPDLIAAWFVKVENVEMVDLYHNYYDQWAMHRPVHVHKYQEGTLIIDLVDVKRNQVVWHGATSDRVYAGMPDVEEKINAAVQAMFDKYAEDVIHKMDYVSTEN